jgi:hypothetical protein
MIETSACRIRCMQDSISPSFSGMNGHEDFLWSLVFWVRCKSSTERSGMVCYTRNANVESCRFNPPNPTPRTVRASTCVLAGSSVAVLAAYWDDDGRRLVRGDLPFP